MKVLKLACALFCVAALGFVANAAHAAKDPKDIKIGYSAKQLANPWFVAVKNGMDKACQELGIQCIVIDAQNRVDKQVSDLENMIADKYDAIDCTPIDANALTDLYVEANKAGIVTGSLAQIVDGSNLQYGMDEYNYGYVIGKQAGEWARDTLKCKGKVVLITEDNVEATIRRGDGMKQAILDICPDITIVGRQAGANPELGMKIVESTLQQHPDLNMAVSQTDAGGVGAYQAMVANNAVGPDRAVFSGDATPEALALMQEPDSIYRGTADLHPFKGGYETIKYLYEMVQNGAPAEPKVIELPYGPVPQADVLSGKYVAGE